MGFPRRRELTSTLLVAGIFLFFAASMIPATATPLQTKSPGVRRTIVLIHVGKTGGTTAYRFLQSHFKRNYFSELHLVSIHSVVKGGNYGVLFTTMREPLSRFVSAFLWVKHRKKFELPKEFADPFFECFDRANKVAEALSSDTPCGDLAREELIANPKSHLGKGYNWTFSSLRDDPDFDFLKFLRTELILVQISDMHRGLDGVCLNATQTFGDLLLEENADCEHGGETPVNERRGATVETVADLSPLAIANLLKYLKAEFDMFELINSTARTL